MLLSLFSGIGGLDLGFEKAGFDIKAAFDISSDSVATYNHNRPTRKIAKVKDIKKLKLSDLDAIDNVEFAPEGVIGGPPCQGFSRGNTSVKEKDPRNHLTQTYVKIIKQRVGLMARLP